jgi:hypothetical protein
LDPTDTCIVPLCLIAVAPMRTGLFSERSAPGVIALPSATGFPWILKHW